MGKLVGGIRLHHKTLHNCVVVIPMPHRDYKVPFNCPQCGETHKVKTYHLTLDNNGDTIVSETVANRLREVNLPEIEVLNVVRHPPKMTLQVAGAAVAFRIEEKPLGGANG